MVLYPADAAPDVYTVVPPQPTEKKSGQLEQWQVSGARYRIAGNFRGRKFS